MKQTSFIYNLIRGIAIVFGFSSMFSKSEEYKVLSDSESLASDWKTVENDMRASFNDFRNKYC
ncbi:hypothetical protein [Gemella haemolysans]|uniref:hypothetical protein n=1 Tax=Gemella haemolysans TaxID=1379 RepID=UPI00195A7900|nr:hypothetical protein [Gemella haemolysans]MDU3832332.1 hypothetical protein [Gemella haemolysans]VTX52179.1 Uncharacterised protein [Gemella haemolysans]